MLIISSCNSPYSCSFKPQATTSPSVVSVVPVVFVVLKTSSNKAHRAIRAIRPIRVLKLNITDIIPEDYKQLLQEIAELKKQVKSERLRADFYEEMVAFGKEVYGIDLKKAGTK